VTDNPRTGSYNLRLTGGGLSTIRHSHIFSANENTIFGRVAIYLHTHNYDGDSDLLTFYDQDGACQMSLSFDVATYTFQLKRGGTGTPIAYGYLVIQPDRYYVLEWKYTVDNSVGEFTTKINSVTDLTFSGDTQATANASVRSFQIRPYQTLVNYTLLDVDDVAINNDEGAEQNTWIGLGGIFLLKPNAEGDVQEWTPSAGTVHWSLVDDVPANTTDFVQAGSAALELFNLEACPDYVGAIDVVQVVYQSAVITSGSQELVDVVRQGTVDYEGGTVTEVSLTDTYVLHGGVFYYSQPSGAGAWDLTALNALQAGIEIPA
jgi:hypothetical protein